MKLNDRMALDHVIRVHPDGSVTDATGEYAPEVCVELDENGQIMTAGDFDDGTPGYPGSYANMIALVESAGWELMTAPDRTPVWDPAYFVGGQLEADILEAPGLYVVCEVTGLYPSEEAEEADSDDPIGWVVARKLDD